MAEPNRPEKLIISELNKELKQKTLTAIFMKYGQIVGLTSRKYRETNKSRKRCNNGAAFEASSGVKGAGAAGGVHAKLSDGRVTVEQGKASRVERVASAAFGGGRLGPPPPPRCTGPPRGGRRGRDGNRGSRRLPTHLADGSSSIKK